MIALFTTLTNRFNSQWFC